MIRSRRSLLIAPAAIVLAVVAAAPVAAVAPSAPGSVGLGVPVVLQPEAGSVAHGPGPVGAEAMGPGISVADAASSDLVGPLLVNGILVAMADGTIRLVEDPAALDDATDGASGLLVEGLDRAGYDWSDADGARVTGFVQVLGTVQDGTISLSVTSI